MATQATVFIVDDDPAIRKLLSLLLDEVSQPYRTFSSASEFLDDYDPSCHGCLILDVRLPGMSGIELHRRLVAEGITIPVILLTGHGDIAMAVEALQRGAADFMEKPIKPQVFLDRIQQALVIDVERRQVAATNRDIEARFALLTPREREVVALVASGLTNKGIAAKLGVSPQAIDAHRSKAMDKLGTDSVAQLAQLVLRAGLAQADQGQSLAQSNLS